MSSSDLFQLSDSQVVRTGLQHMLETLCPIDFYCAEQWTKSWVEIAPALFLVEIMKRAEDLPEYFPRGKWATIQAIEDRLDEALTKYLSTPVVKP
jgi:hypothetical protein